MDITWEVIMQIVGSLGFPIFVAIYMLMKLSKDSESICECLNKLERVIAVLTERIEKKND